MRIVVKIGSSSLTGDDGTLESGQLGKVCEAAAGIRSAGHDVVLVSSGAIAAGFRPLGFEERPISIVGMQASASVGQGLLIEAYSKGLKAHGLLAAQILLTRKDFASRDTYQNAFNTFEELLARGAVPIVNENDTTAVGDLTFGENDMLSALVAGLLHADRLVVFTETDGVFDKNPTEHGDAKKISKIATISDELIDACGGSTSLVGTGGMAAKLRAAKLAHSMGVPVYIGALTSSDVITQILSGEGSGTYLDGEVQNKTNRKDQWIGIHSEQMGILKIDDGAEKALVSGGKSLLAVGVTNIQGVFSRGDVVKVTSRAGVPLGRGVSNFNRDELDQIRGKNSAQIGEILGDRKPEVIHRDYWVPQQTRD